MAHVIKILNNSIINTINKNNDNFLRLFFPSLITIVLVNVAS
jgi:hypothetical protein